MAIVLLVLSGIVYRVAGSRLELLTAKPSMLPVPLSNFPMQIGRWSGRDLVIATTTQEYMQRNFADDYISRRYINSETKSWADVYVVYCSTRPGGLLGHRPRICYPGNGWIHNSTKESTFVTKTGRSIPCLIHRFSKPDLLEDIVVMNFYILNGSISTDESKFSGLFGRRPNIEGNPARYVAQVQISSFLESSVLAAATEMAESILDFMPDANGKARAAEYINITSSALN